MKLKDLKEKMNSFSSDMDDVEVMLTTHDGCDLMSDLDIYTHTVNRITDKYGNLHKFSFNKGEEFYVCGRKLTYADEGMTETEELAIIIN